LRGVAVIIFSSIPFVSLPIPSRKDLASFCSFATLTMKLFLVALAAIVAVSAAATCDSEGVSNQSQCDAQCPSCTICTFAEVNGIATCTCASGNGVEFTCTDVSGFDDISFDDDAFTNLDDFNFDDISFDDVDIGDIRDFYVQLLGEQCRSAVNSAITKSLFNCLTDATSFDFGFENGFTTSAVDAVCANTCIRTMFSAITTLADADCLSFGDVSPFDVSAFEDAEDMLSIICAEGGNNFCGVVYGIVGDFVENGSISTADCQTIVDSGSCLGTVAAAVNDGDIPVDDDSIDTSAIESDLNDACTTNGVSGITNAAQGTVAPANLASSSASTTVASLVAAVAMVAAAALF